MIEDNRDAGKPAPSSGPAEVQIRAGHSCYRGLTWDCELTPRKSVDLIIAHLLSLGFKDESRGARVRELAHPEGHRVILIPSTGRVQLRLHYLTPPEKRREVAENFAGLLLGAARAAA